MIINRKLNLVVPVACIAILMLCKSAFAQSIDATSARQINAANELVRAGKVAEAIETYQQVPVDPKLADKVNYNTAVARYRGGDIDSAEKLFMESAGSPDKTIAANSRYNLGNCLYGKAVQLSETDKPAAIENLRRAIDHYRGALRGDPNNPDARANIELAAELIRKLQEEQKQEEQEQQNQNQQQQDQQQQDQQNSEDQSNESDSQQSESQNQDSNNEQNSEEQNSEQENSDQRQSEQKESQGNESEQSDSQESKDDHQDQSEQPSDSQSDEQKESDSKQQNQSQPQNKQQQSRDQQQPDETARESEEEANKKPVPTGDLQAAEEQDDEQDDRKPNGSVAMADPNEKDGLMSKEEAMKMLQAVRDRDMLRRLRQEQIERSQHRPVDRDW